MSNTHPVIRSILIGPDGRLLIGGFLDQVEGSTRRGLARLHPDGSLDGSFEAGIPDLMIGVTTMALQWNGNLVFYSNEDDFLVAGYQGLARLQPDGSVDASFNPGADLQVQPVWALALKPDGKMLLGGEFQRDHEASLWRVVRLHGDGHPFFLSAPHKMVEGPFRFSIISEAGRRYTIQGSADLITWDDLETVTAQTERFEFTDASATALSRFYRVQKE